MNKLAPMTVSDATRFVFIVGAPRCGTTFLASHLARHPLVCFSKVKEPHFFAANDLRNLGDEELGKRVRSEYLDRFFPHRHGSPFLVEASVTYLYMPEQLEPILRLWPQSKFIVAVRDPLRLLPSLHQRLRYIGDETIEDFDRAWALVPERRAGRHVPRRCADPRFLDYWEAGRLGSNLQRLFEVVGRERCFVSIFDDLVADPAGQYRKVLDFLGLPDDFQDDFAPARESSGYKIEWLQRILKRPPRAAISVLASEQYQLRTGTGKNSGGGGFGAKVLRARKRLLKWNRAPAPPVHVSAHVEDQMREMFADEIALLETLVERRLGHWLGRGKA
ncbi:MAG TPA: sulfotransferase [Sphingomicrobium sp.]|nr:sulfotransferase [Sphingomicrobium sp.]